jgi:hypothetical protein
MPNTRPDLYLDETGECSACITYRNRPLIDWDARKQELLKILDEHDGKCLVASSGGKDSHYIALTLLQLGADVTVVTATTDDLSPIGKRNIQNLARYAPTIEVTPNQTVRRKIARIGLRTVGDISYGEHMAIWATPFHVAVQTKTPLIFYGENPQNEIAGPLGSEQAKTMTRRWQSEFGGFLGLRAMDLVGQDGITEKDVKPYMLPADTKDVTAYFLGMFLPWDGLHNAEVARDQGFEWYHDDVECSVGRFESLDNHQTGIHEWFKKIKYNFARPTDMVSLAIRRGRMTREEALAIVEDRETFPWTYLGKPYEDILDLIGISTDEFEHICRKFMNYGLFEKSETDWWNPVLKPECLLQAA